jgi:hypothetical protein
VALQFGTGLLGSVAYGHALEPGYLRFARLIGHSMP